MRTGRMKAVGLFGSNKVERKPRKVMSTKRINV